MFDIEERIVEVRRRKDAIDAEWLALVAEYDRSDVWQASGYLSAAAGVRRLCRMDPGRAAAEVKLARKTAALSELADALQEGAISRPHVEAIAYAYTPERSEALAGLEHEFVDAARRFEPREVRNLVRYVTDALDGDGGAASDEEQHGRRLWHMSRTIDGLLKVDALFSGVDAECWETAINSAVERDRAAGDARTPAQSRADAATSIVRRALDTGTLGNARQVRPHVTVVVDVDDLPGARPETIGILQSERRYRGVLSRAALDRLMCDCDITRVLMVGASQVLDVGRATRTVTRASGMHSSRETGTALPSTVMRPPNVAKRITAGDGAREAPPISTTSSCSVGIIIVTGIAADEDPKTFQSTKQRDRATGSATR